MRKLLKIWNGIAKNLRTFIRVALQISYQWSDFRSTHQLRGKCVVILVNMNANQAFCVAIAVLLLQIINIQLQQMFAFFILYQRWANEYREILNIAILRRRRHFRRVRNRPYTWTIPRPADSWFDIHYNDPTIPQEYFRQQLRVNRNTFKQYSISWARD